MKHISVQCHGRTKKRILHQTQNGRYYTMEKVNGGGVKRKYVYPKKH